MDSTPPAKGNEALRFRHLKPDLGKSYKGWVAGPYFGMRSHHIGTSKPCVRAITKDNLPCVCEVQKLKVGWTGYLPYWDEHGRKMVVTFGVDSEGTVARFTFGQPIKITKGSFKAAPVLVFADQWNTGPCPFIRGLRAQLDINKWLLNLWGIEELKEYFKHEPSSPIPIPREGPVQEVLFDTSPTINEMPKLGAMFDDPQLVNRLPHNLTNGKHPAKKKKG